MKKSYLIWITVWIIVLWSSILYAYSEFYQYAISLAKTSIIKSQSREADYRLSDTLSRAEAMKLVLKSAGISQRNCMDFPESGLSFLDVGRVHWDLCGYIEWAVAVGIVPVRQNRLFSPNMAIDRATFVYSMVTAYDHAKPGLIPPHSGESYYTDIPASSTTLIQAVNRLSATSCITRSTKSFRPAASITRGEAFKVMSCLASLGNSQSTTSQTPGTLPWKVSSDNLYRTITVSRYNNVSVDVIVDNAKFTKLDKTKPVDILVTYHGTVVTDDKVVQWTTGLIGKTNWVISWGNYLTIGVAYPEWAKIAWGNIAEAEAGLLYAKNNLASELGLKLGRVFLIGHSQWAYIVAVLNTMQKTDGVISNSPGPIDHKLLCERVEGGIEWYGGGARTFTCNGVKDTYGSVYANPTAYINRSLLGKYSSGYKSDILFIQGLKDENPLQMEQWPSFKAKVLSCTDCMEVDVLDIANGWHGSAFETVEGKNAINQFLSSH